MLTNLALLFLLYSADAPLMVMTSNVVLPIHFLVSAWSSMWSQNQLFTISSSTEPSMRLPASSRYDSEF